MTTKRTNRPTSAAQIAANQRNGPKGSGATTAEGKARAAANSLRTGLYATRATAIPRGVLAEDQSAVEDFISECVADLDPKGIHQELAARQVAVAQLRLLRFEALEAIQLGEAGRMTPSMDSVTPGIGTDAHLRAQIAALAEFHEFAQCEGVYDIVDVDPDVLLGVLPPGAHGHEHQAGTPAPSPGGFSRQSLEAQLVSRVGDVWLGDWKAAANWAETATRGLQIRLDRVEGRGAELAAKHANEQYLDNLTKLYARLDASLDRALARFNRLRARSANDQDSN